MKSCAVTNTGRTYKQRVPKIVWSGQLPTKNMTWEKAKLRLASEEETHELLSETGARSAYYALFRQGATLVPRPLWCVDVDDSIPMNKNVPRLKTSEYAYKATKEEKWKVRLKGPVEREFLFCTVLGEDLLPFMVRRQRLFVLPVVVDGE